jgi:hypothetical protein
VASDPLTRLALSMSGNPGVYATTIGSGVSTAVGIPTGWDVQVDLMARVATAEGVEVDETDPDALAAWWKQAHGTDPTYSALLEELAATPHERQALLRSYFVPTPEERQQGLKVPGPAHDSLARLVATGGVRVILTTNFDRLVEQALTAHELDFDVWSTPEEIEGGVPLVHGRTVVIKIHGDYQSSRLLNTDAELRKYDDRVKGLLADIFDSFGLIVCGWSAEHDHALRAAMQAAPSRRYTWWWSVRGDSPRGVAAELVKHRDATVVPDRDADAFFSDLAERHAALLGRVTTGADDIEVLRTVASQRAVDPAQRSRLLQQLLDEAVRIRDAIGDEDRFPRLTQINAETAVSRVAGLVELSRPLVVQLAQVAIDADGDDGVDLVGRSLEVLEDVDDNAWFTDVPQMLAWYAVGVTLVDHDRLDTLRRLGVDVMLKRRQDRVPLVAAMHPWDLVASKENVAQWLAWGGPSDRKKHAPLSQWLEPVTRDLLSAFPVAATDERWTRSFDRFEWAAGLLLAGVGHGREPRTGPWVPPPQVGNFAWRYRYDYDGQGRWRELIEWAEAHLDVLLQHVDIANHDAVVEEHAKHIADVARNYH